MNARAHTSLAALSLLVVGCGGSNNGTLVSAQSGGRVESPDGVFSLEIPPGALESDTRISIAVLDPIDYPDAIDPERVLGRVYDVRPDGLVFGVPVAARWAFAVPPAAAATETPVLAAATINEDGQLALESLVTVVRGENPPLTAIAWLSHSSPHFLDLGVGRALDCRISSGPYPLFTPFPADPCTTTSTNPFSGIVSGDEYFQWGVRATPNNVLVPMPFPDGTIRKDGDVVYSELQPITALSAGATDVPRWMCREEGVATASYRFHMMLPLAAIGDRVEWEDPPMCSGTYCPADASYPCRVEPGFKTNVSCPPRWTCPVQETSPQLMGNGVPFQEWYTDCLRDPCTWDGDCPEGTVCVDYECYSDTSEEGEIITTVGLSGYVLCQSGADPPCPQRGVIIDLNSLQGDPSCAATVSGDLGESNEHSTGMMSKPAEPSTDSVARSASSAVEIQADLDGNHNNSLFPCGPGAKGYTVCPNPKGTLTAGTYHYIANAFADAIPVADPMNQYVYAFVFDADGITSNNYQASVSYPKDFYDDSDRWYEVSYHPASGWSIKVSSARNGLIQTQTSPARAILRDNVIVLMVPASEFEVGKPAYRVTSFRHTGDYGLDPPHDWSGDIEPPVGEPLAPLP